MSKQQQFIYFGKIFISSFLVLIGIGTVVIMAWPVIDAQLKSKKTYQPFLPIAEAREGEFEDINELPARKLYTPLSEIKDVSEGNWIYIPSIGVKVPLALSPSMEDVDVLKTLDIGATLYPNGVEPGHLGNVFVAAHSTGEPWKGKYRFAFLQINELEPGNIIHIDYEGIRYSYSIVSEDIVKPSADFRIVSDRPVPTVTLMACWPLWSTKERMLIKAELTNVTNLNPTPT